MRWDRIRELFGKMPEPVIPDEDAAQLVAAITETDNWQVQTVLEQGEMILQVAHRVMNVVIVYGPQIKIIMGKQSQLPLMRRDFSRPAYKALKLALLGLVESEMPTLQKSIKEQKLSSLRSMNKFFKEQRDRKRSLLGAETQKREKLDVTHRTMPGNIT